MLGGGLRIGQENQDNQKRLTEIRPPGQTPSRRGEGGVMPLRGRVWLVPTVAAALMFLPAARAGGRPDPRTPVIPGDLDPAFGTGGIVTMDFGGPSGARTVNIQPDGQIVAGGWTTALDLH